MIPYYKQEKDWYCGPAVMQMFLASQKVLSSQDQLARELNTTQRRGTDNNQILNYLKNKQFEYSVQRGLDPQTALEKLASAIKQKRSILITYWHLTDKIGHFALVKKLTRKTITLQDPDKGPSYTLALKTFLKNWHDSEGNPHWFVAIKPKVR